MLHFTCTYEINVTWIQLFQVCVKYSDKSACQCYIVVFTISKKVVCTVHTTILHWHWQENPMCTYDIFHLQFHRCYLLSDYKPLRKQCRICHLRLWKLSTSAILNFWTIAGFWRKLYVVHTTILQKPENTKWRIRLYCTDTAKYRTNIAFMWSHFRSASEM